MATLAATMLMWPGTALDQLWYLNKPAHLALVPIRNLMGPVFLLLGGTLVTTAIGWFKQRMWAWRMAVIIIGIQLAGDLVNLLRGDYVRGGVGVIVAGLLLWYLLQSNLRREFQGGAKNGT